MNPEAWLEGLINTIYPLRCGLCGLCKGTGLCEDCQTEFQAQAEPVHHHGPHEPFQVRISLYSYHGRVAQAIQRLKYERVTSLADPLAKLLYDGFRSTELPPFDQIVPVPIHWKRRYMRGFNQAELLAREFFDSESQGSPLLRIRPTRPQVGLSPLERLSNLTGAFRACDDVRGKTVLLIDDVYTSGGTARACGAALREAGATYVGVLTLATGSDLNAL